MHKPVARLFLPIDAASLAVFRIGFGAVLLFDSLRYLFAVCLSCYYIEPQFHFSYYGFGWIAPWQGVGVYAHFAAMAVLSLGIMLGYHYRLATLLFTLLFAHMFFWDQAQYLNHFYMVLLFCILLCVMPAHHYWSLDARRRPALASATVPAWTRWLLCLQLEIILIYAGLVKINADWLNLEPLASWLGDRGDFPLLGTLFTQQWSVAVAAYGVVLLHLVGAPLLLVRRTRLYVLGIYACFHTLNHFVFNIGIFPWVTLFASLLCFDPDWPRQFADWLGRRWRSQHFRQWFERRCISLDAIRRAPRAAPTVYAISLPVLVFASLWLGFQLLMPLRHFAYPGNVNWTEEGHRFAWRMKLRGKTGYASFVISDPHSGSSWRESGRDYLSARQRRKMRCRPDMILQFAHFLGQQWQRERQLQNVEVRAEVRCSLNDRGMAALIDPQRDLMTVERNLRANDWIVPLDKAPKYSVLPDRLSTSLERVWSI